MMVLMTALSALLVLAFLLVLAIALHFIRRVLESIGGRPTSYLAKLRLGLRAIEKETSALPSGLGQVNEQLSRIAGGLAAVERHLEGTVAAVTKQGG